MDENENLGTQEQGASTEGSSTPAEPAGFDVNQFQTEGWRDFIPEDLRDRSEWSRVSNVQDVFKNYISAQQTISKSVRIPDATSSAEDIEAFYNKLGKPKSSADYDFTYNKTENDFFDKDSFNFDSFKDIASQANLTQTQYQALAKAYIDAQNQNYNVYRDTYAEQAGAELREAEAELRKEWGKDYGSNINNITAKITQLYPQDTINRMAESGLFRDTNFLKSQLALTKMMTGDTIFIEGQPVENVPQTIENLRAKRDALMQEDYVRNKTQVNDLNQRIIELQMAQQGQLRRRM